ncbi:polysaccharide pyruvyl transferase family protein [Ruminococcus sp. 5_1_39BFAA]|uniref:polysaccharide pyruvyl transferase family protein n=1 Tax=Ruminococcus sp. 5_1_39BFAA TaxID=457412 RepID=UPI003562B6EB
MKIGILTVFDAVNYGSFLQAYCLQTVIQRKCNTQVRMIKDSSLLYEKWRITSLISYNPRKAKFKGKLAAGYLKSWKNFKVSSMREQFDLVVVGSDEMWEVNNITMKPRPSFWGNGLKTRRLVTYAVSSNSAKTEQLSKYAFIEEGLKKFDRVSVRDVSTFNAYLPLLGTEPVYCIDPTLLVDLHQLARKQNKYSNYILCYTYTFKPETLKAVQDLAEKYGKRIIVVGQNFKWADESIPADPFEFLGLLESADFVVTDTFHGTVLSIALNKQFVTAAYKEKVFRIIEQFDLLDRNIDGCSNIISYYQSEIDYSTINRKIDILRQQSLEYIDECLMM